AKAGPPGPRFRFERTGAGILPNMRAAENAVVRIRQPERAEIPLAMLANNLQDSRRSGGYVIRGRQGLGYRVLGRGSFFLAPAAGDVISHADPPVRPSLRVLQHPSPPGDPSPLT